MDREGAGPRGSGHPDRHVRGRQTGCAGRRGPGACRRGVGLRPRAAGHRRIRGSARRGPAPGRAGVAPPGPPGDARSGGPPGRRCRAGGVSSARRRPGADRGRRRRDEPATPRARSRGTSRRSPPRGPHRGPRTWGRRHPGGSSVTVPSASGPVALEGILAALVAAASAAEPAGDVTELVADLRDALDRGASEDAIFERVRLLDGAGHARRAVAVVAGHPDTPRRPDLLLGLAGFLLDAIDPAAGLSVAEHVGATADPSTAFDAYRRAHLLAAEGRLALGDRPGARRAYEAVLAYDLDDARAMAGLARLSRDGDDAPVVPLHVEGIDAVYATFAGAGRYRLVRPLGRGRHAIVYLAEDTRLGRTLAVKRLLPPRAVSDPGAARRLARRFVEEAATLDRIRSPHVVRLYDVLPDERAVVLEYCDAGSLRERLREGPLSSDELAELAVALRRGLEAIFAAGVVHRDIKPANVLLRSREPRFVVADLGLAVPREHATDRFGALRYLAPELRHGHGRPSRATDAYAAGVVLLEAALAPDRLPAAFDDPAGPADARAHVPEDLPKDLRTQILGMLDPAPHGRLW
ncbi:MAG: serine/threonine protein kinase [Deltaproteobacteria bacterium]|nr:MAG: serine/threonine protein kinase [Deltaproteobacteria bacterium]